MDTAPQIKAERNPKVQICCEIYNSLPRTRKGLLSVLLFPGSTLGQKRRAAALLSATALLQSLLSARQPALGGARPRVQALITLFIGFNEHICDAVDHFLGLATAVVLNPVLRMDLLGF